jgi:hypothetical protein
VPTVQLTCLRRGVIMPAVPHGPWAVAAHKGDTLNVSGTCSDAPAADGSAVTVATSLTIDGATNPTTKISATVPSRATTGPVKVTAAGGSFTTKTEFKVT